MSTWSKIAAAAALATATAWAQSADSRSSLKINFPADSPVTLVSADWGESKATPRGGAMVLDLHASLLLKNTGPKRVRGVTLVLLAQDVAAGGKASVSVPSLDVAAGEVFPVRVDLRLLRPIGAGPLVQVSLDGVLFDDLSFYGPDRLHSRRSMTAWELEARRDRKHFKTVLEAQGAEALRGEILASLARQADRPQMDVQMSRTGRATNSEAERQVRFTFLHLPGAPVEPLEGVATLAGSEVRAPRLDVKNRSDRGVEYLELGWILRDRQGREFLAGTLPAQVSIAPGAGGVVTQTTALRVTERGVPVALDSVAGFVSQVQFGDGKMWVPERSALQDARLRRLIGLSAEEQRLAELYRRKGLAALVEELKKF